MTTPAPEDELQLLGESIITELFALDANELGRLPRDLERCSEYLETYAMVTMATIQNANTTEGSTRVSIVDTLARPSFIQTSVPFAVRLGTTHTIFDAWVWEGKGLAIVPELTALAVQEEGKDRWVVVSSRQLFWHLNDTCKSKTITELFDQVIAWLSGLADKVDAERAIADTPTQPIDIVDTPSADQLTAV